MKLYTFDVKGVATFPLDMLRFDACWPARQDDASTIGWLFSPRRNKEVAETHVIRLTGVQTPTAARWESFGWRVIGAQPKAG